MGGPSSKYNSRSSNFYGYLYTYFHLYLYLLSFPALIFPTYPLATQMNQSSLFYASNQTIMACRFPRHLKSAHVKTYLFGHIAHVHPGLPIPYILTNEGSCGRSFVPANGVSVCIILLNPTATSGRDTSDSLSKSVWLASCKYTMTKRSKNIQWCVKYYRFCM